MQLHFQTAGQPSAKALVFIHGLFGAGDNWRGIAQHFANGYYVVMPDLRNHGRSPHSAHQSYALMADDLHSLYKTLGIQQAHIVGHSIGGKVAMTFADQYPDLIDQLVIVDMANKAYADTHTDLIDAMLNVDLSDKVSRNAVDAALTSDIPNKMIRQFLLMNLTRGDNGLNWRINLKALKENHSHLSAGVCQSGTYNKPCLIMRGTKSDYIQAADIGVMQQYFTDAALVELDTDHWVHAEAPQDFMNTLMHFFESA